MLPKLNEIARKTIGFKVANFSTLSGSDFIKFVRDINTFEARAEALETDNPGKGLQLAYHEALAEIFQKSYVDKIMNKKMLYADSPEELVGLFDEHIMRPYVKALEKQGDKVDVELNPEGGLNLTTLESFKKIADGVETSSYFEKTVAELNADPAAYGRMMKFMEEKRALPPDEIESTDSVRLTAMAMAIEDRRNKRTFKEAFLNLGTHIKEWFAIRAMRKIVSSADNLETLEQLVTERQENNKLRDLKETLNGRINDLKGVVSEEKEKMIFIDEEGIENAMFSDRVKEFDPNETNKSFISQL